MSRTATALVVLILAASSAAQDCNGDGIDDSLQLHCGNAVTFPYVDPGGAPLPSVIPYEPFPTRMGLQRTITIGAGDAVAICDLRMAIETTGTFIGYLHVTLRHEHPAGGIDTMVTLIDMPGEPDFGAVGFPADDLDIVLGVGFDSNIETDAGPADGFFNGATVTGFFRSHPGSLAAFVGQTSEGTWTLDVKNLVGGTGQALIDWGLIVDSTTSETPPSNDCNGNGIPDFQLCETDSDDDSVIDDCDNCPGVFNPDQGDADGDGIGDLCDEAWSDEGCALAGVSGDPLLVGSGTLTAGAPNTLDLGNAAPSATAGVFYGLSSTPTAFKGGTIKPFPFFGPILFSTDPAGSISLLFLTPAGLPGGTELWVQWAIQDAAAVQGVALSNAVLGVVP